MTDRDPAPKSSDELIAQARAALRRSNPDVGASEELMSEAHAWLESGKPMEMVATVPAVREEPLAPPSGTDTGYDDLDLDDLDGFVFEEPARRPRPARIPPSPVPPTQIPSGRRRRSGKRIISLAVGIAAAAALANLAGVFLAQEDDGGVEVTQATVANEITVVSEGSITSASDPCSGATISGDLEATVTYWDDADVPAVDVRISGPQLQGSDGSTYDLELSGSAIGNPGQQTFTFEADRMTMTRDDGLVIQDWATVTVEITDGEPSNWSYSTVGAECPG